MSLPIQMYAVKVPPNGQVFPAVPLGVPAPFRVTMAAIDPTEVPHREDVDDTTEPFAVLKVTRIVGGLEDEDDSDFDEDDLDSDEDSDDEEVNGGPSDPKKSKSLKKQALLEALAADDEDEDMEDDSGDDSGEEAEAQAVLAKLQKALKDDKGKGPALDEEDDSDDESDESVEVTETVICTLNRTNFPQQTLDFTVGAQEQVFFKVVGNFTVHVTGNYVMPPDADDEHDLEPDSDEELDELDGLDDLVGDSDSEIDELDDLEDPRIAEIEDEDAEDANEMKKLIKQVGEIKKGKNKRPAEDSEDEEPALDEMISKSMKQEEAKKEAAPAATEPTTNGETKKLSKAEKKRLKKLKNNEGTAVDAPAAAAPETNGSKDKKVQFAKELEQGPTPSPASTTKSAAAPAAAASKPSVRTVQGITIDDRKVGTGAAAKKGSVLSMRYIGKLASNNKQFDSNKSGKPFSFKLGKGEVIKGWDIGLEGMQNGGERRITIPANLAYGKKGAPPDIPPNSTLMFDVKCVGVK